MQLRVEVKLLQFFCYFSGTILNLLPLQIRFFQNNIKVSNCCFGSKITWFWRILLLISWVFILTELISNIFIAKNDKIATNIYQLYIVLARSATISYIYVFQTKSQDISHLLNCLIRKPRTNLFHKNKTNNKKHRAMILASMFACSVGIAVFYSIVMPAVVFALPCLYESPLTKRLNWRCKIILSRVIVSLMEFIFFLPTSAAGSVVIPVFLIALDETRNELQNLW